MKHTQEVTSPNVPFSLQARSRMNLVKVIGRLDEPAWHPGGVGVVAVRLEGLGVVSVPLGLGILPLGSRGHVIQHLGPIFNLNNVRLTIGAPIQLTYEVLTKILMKIPLKQQRSSNYHLMHIANDKTKFKIFKVLFVQMNKYGWRELNKGFLLVFVRISKVN